MSDGLQPNRVCYTEDSNRWPEFVTRAFTAFGFEVDHFETNSGAWEDPERGIFHNPGRHDVYVFDNDTGPDSIEGPELIKRLLTLPRELDRDIIVIILSSSNPGIFTDRGIRTLREQHHIQLCWKPDSWCLQAEYARNRIDQKATYTFEEWILETRDIDLSRRGSDNQLSKANDELFEKVRQIEAEREGKVRGQLK